MGFAAAISLANVPAYVYHGAVAATARPSGVSKVIWVGSVDPTNKATNDTWIRAA